MLTVATDFFEGDRACSQVGSFTHRGLNIVKYVGWQTRNRRKSEVVHCIHYIDISVVVGPLLSLKGNVPNPVDSSRFERDDGSRNDSSTQTGWFWPTGRIFKCNLERYAAQTSAKREFAMEWMVILSKGMRMSPRHHKTLGWESPCKKAGSVDCRYITALLDLYKTKVDVYTAKSDGRLALLGTPERLLLPLPMQ